MKDGTVTRDPSISLLKAELSTLEKELMHQETANAKEMQKIKSQLAANKEWFESVIKKSIESKV